ncbi:MAG: hypothetical protein IT426_21270 [Pirellulales bacterium]|nr:hypothetical protein [Pirellulales bacterium]
MFIGVRIDQRKTSLYDGVMAVLSNNHNACGNFRFDRIAVFFVAVLFGVLGNPQFVRSETPVTDLTLLSQFSELCDETISEWNAVRSDAKGSERPLLRQNESPSVPQAVRQTTSVPDGGSWRPTETSFVFIAKNGPIPSRSFLRSGHCFNVNSISQRRSLEILFCTWQT